jgi:23S rRNA pseudouridine955/2504/2580 synthase
LHARRLIVIEHPDGTPLDVTAPLPDHFAASMAQLGFDEADGEMLPDWPDPAGPREGTHEETSRPRRTPSSTARNAAANGASAR